MMENKAMEYWRLDFNMCECVCVYVCVCVCVWK